MIAAEEQTSQPVDFTFYGLDADWSGPRWLDFFEGLDGEPAWALWLGHRLLDEADLAGEVRPGDRGVRVGTLPRRRYDNALSPRSGDHLAAVAFSAAFGLVNLTLPDGSVPRPDGLIPALVGYAEHQSRQHGQWPRVLWDVDGAAAPASVLRFAGAWAGFTDILEDSYLVAVGIGVPPEDLRLLPVTDASWYGMDLAEPLSVSELGRQRREQPDNWLPPPQRDGFHPDQLALVPGD